MALNVISIFPIATGIKVKPIVVMTEPVTIDGKRLATLRKCLKSEPHKSLKR